MDYETRHMVARRSFVHCGRLVNAGDALACADIDANYYERHDMARPAEAPAAAPEQSTAAPMRRGRRQIAAEPAAEAPPPPAAPPADPGFITAADAGADTGAQ